MKKLSVLQSLLAAMVLLVGHGSANALPVSSCNNVTCDLYESDAQGNATERPPALTLPAGGKSGYAVINEKGTDLGSQQDGSTWSDVILFMNNTAELFSDPIVFKGDPGENVPFTRIDVLHSQFNGAALAATTVFQNEDTDPTVYQPVVEAVFQNRPGGPGDPGGGVQGVYNIHSDVNEGDDTDVPEPVSLLLVGFGLVGVLVGRQTIKK